MDRSSFDAFLLQHGLLPISGGRDDDTPDPVALETGDETLPAGGGDDTLQGGAGAAPAGEGVGNEPTEADLLAQERERSARLEGELSALRRPAPKAEPKERPLEALSVTELDALADDYQRKIDSGDIATGLGARSLGRIEATRAERLRLDRETREAPVRRADAKLAEYMTKYPDLNRGGSDLLGRVRSELPTVVAEFGFAADDPRAQVIAVERVVRGHQMGGASHEILRRKIPTGGAGSGGEAGGGDGGKKDPLRGVPTEVLSYWKRSTSDDKQLAEYAEHWRQKQERRRLRASA